MLEVVQRLTVPARALESIVLQAMRRDLHVLPSLDEMQHLLPCEPSQLIWPACVYMCVQEGKGNAMSLVRTHSRLSTGWHWLSMWGPVGSSFLLDTIHVTVTSSSQPTPGISRLDPPVTSCLTRTTKSPVVMLLPLPCMFSRSGVIFIRDP